MTLTTPISMCKHKMPPFQPGQYPALMYKVSKSNTEMVKQYIPYIASKYKGLHGALRQVRHQCAFFRAEPGRFACGGVFSHAFAA